jgi:hypothetical protein
MAKKKQVSLGFAIGKDDAERLKSEGVKALDKAQVIIKSASGGIGSTSSAHGYETRIWEKVTCKVADPLLDPEQIINNPEQFGLEITTTKTLPGALQSQKKTK